MRKRVIAGLCLPLTWVLLSLSIRLAEAQSGAVIPEGGAGHAKQASCVILKRMGPADEVTSHLYSFGIRGKQFQFIEGKLPDGLPFHGRLTDHDVRNLQGRGAEVLVLEAHYTAEDLKEARGQCKAMTGESPNQASVPKSAGSQGELEKPLNDVAPSTLTPPTPVAAQVQSTVQSQASIMIVSTPPGADIEIDGAFIGDTPSTVTVTPGAHEIAVKKKGFATWNRKLNVTGGSVHLNAELEQISSN